jgi:HK97 gp10 family phage protein
MIKLSLPQSEMKAFRKWTEQISKEEEAKLKNLVARSGEMITYHAKLDAPVNKKKGAGGRLRSSIASSYSTDGKTFTIEVNVDYAAFQEFGTGKYVRILPGYADIASEFRGKGIRRVNLHAQPYLFDNYERVNKAFLKELNKMGFNERPV